MPFNFSQIKSDMYGVPFSHLFTELQISPIEVHIIANSIADIYN